MRSCLKSEIIPGGAHSILLSSKRTGIDMPIRILATCREIMGTLFEVFISRYISGRLPITVYLQIKEHILSICKQIGKYVDNYTIYGSVNMSHKYIYLSSLKFDLHHLKYTSPALPLFYQFYR